MALRSQSRHGGGLSPSEAVEHGTHAVSPGGALATVLSAIALGFSGLSYYDSSLKSADMTVYVPPMVHYARDGADVFNVPVTISNDGAQSGTVLSLVLDVENMKPNAERKSVRFHGIFLGDYPRDDKTPLRSFAPISVPGHGSVTETVRFYNMGEMLPMLVTDKGDFRFTLTVNTAKSSSGFLASLMQTELKPLTFDLNLPYFAVQRIAFQNGTIAMYNKDWNPAVSSSTGSAVSRKVDSSVSKDGDDTPPTAGDAPAPDTQNPDAKK
jgi:hypothetical protein